jgi:Tol biopolymer transport system component
LKKHFYPGVLMVAAIVLAVTLAGCGGGGGGSSTSTNSFKIVFSSDRDGGLNIWSMNLDGSIPKQLTTSATSTNDISNICPELSPDHTKVLYIKNTYNSTSGTEDSEVYMVDIDGQNNKKVYDPGDDPVLAVWTPKGKILLYESDGSSVALKIIDPNNTTSVTTLSGVSTTNLDIGVDSIRMSPDGSEILVSYNYTLYTLNVSGTTVSSTTKNTITTGSYPISPSWSPDGTKIIFTSSSLTSSGYEIYSVSASGGTATALTSGCFAENPFYTPDSAKIIFTEYSSGYTNYQIYSIDPSGTNTNITNLTKNSHYNGYSGAQIGVSGTFL